MSQLAKCRLDRLWLELCMCVYVAICHAECILEILKKRAFTARQEMEITVVLICVYKYIQERSES